MYRRLHICNTNFESVLSLTNNFSCIKIYLETFDLIRPLIYLNVKIVKISFSIF